MPQATAAPCPGSVQAQNHYLVGLVAYSNGYHFMRRDEHTQRWSHQEWLDRLGFDTIAFQARREKYMYIDNDVAIDVLANPGNWRETSTFLEFIAYFTVPIAGIQVGG